MATLFSKLVKLAYTRPELRPHLLPILKEAATDLCVVCGKPGELIRFTVKGMDRTPLDGRIFLKGTVLCDPHQEMCEGI